jgi:hypothetical protein
LALVGRVRLAELEEAREVALCFLPLLLRVEAVVGLIQTPQTQPIMMVALAAAVEAVEEAKGSMG